MTIDVPTTPRKPMGEMRRLRIWERHSGRCVICERKIQAGEKWIVEHIRALVLGGADDDSNCAPAHESCRRIKDKADVKAGAKAKRMKARHIGIKKAVGRPLMGTKASGWRKPFNGPAERRT